jgi:hypothetical protein
MHETSTPQGELRIVGVIHRGTAINTMVVPYGSPDEWEMKQFVSEQQLHDYAHAHNLVVVAKKEE